MYTWSFTLQAIDPFFNLTPARGQDFGVDRRHNTVHRFERLISYFMCRLLLVYHERSGFRDIVDRAWKAPASQWYLYLRALRWRNGHLVTALTSSWKSVFTPFSRLSNAGTAFILTRSSIALTLVFRNSKAYARLYDNGHPSKTTKGMKKKKKNIFPSSLSSHTSNFIQLRGRKQHKLNTPQIDMPKIPRTSIPQKANTVTLSHPYWLFSPRSLGVPRGRRSWGTAWPMSPSRCAPPVHVRQIRWYVKTHIQFRSITLQYFQPLVRVVTPNSVSSSL